MESMTSQDWQGSHVVTDLMRLPIRALSLTELPCIADPLDFCAHGALGSCMHIARQGTVVNVPTACISFVYVHAPWSS